MKKNRPELYRTEIKSYIVRAGMTMSEVVDFLADEYGWSSSVPNLSGKLKRGSLRYYHIGEGKLRMLIDQNPHEDFYVMNGNRALIKREKFERYLDQATAV